MTQILSTPVMFTSGIESIEDLFAQLSRIIKLPTETNDPFDIEAVSLTGRVIKFKVRPTDTVLQIKQEIYKQDKLMLDQQKLLFNGKKLEDDNTVSDYGIQPNSRIHLVLRLRGGMFHETSSRKNFKNYKSMQLMDKGLSMLQYMRGKYDRQDVIDKIYTKLVNCKEEELSDIVNTIETHYVN